MIFAKLDVCFWRHPRFIDAGLESCAFWAAALAWLRETESSTGFVSFARAKQLLDVGDKKARKLGERLVQFGLFDRCEGGYLLVRYSEKNETREQIDARRAAARERQAAFQRNRRAANGVSNGVHNGQPNAFSTLAQRVADNALLTPTEPESESESESESDLLGAPAALALEVTEPKTAPRRRHKYPETFAPDPSADQAEFSEWCRRWGFSPTDRTVVAMARTHYGKGNKWRDWKAAHRTWLEREKDFRPNGSALPPTNAELAAADRRSKPPTEPPMSNEERAAAAANLLQNLGGSRG